MKPIHCVALVALLAGCGAGKSAQPAEPSGATTPMAPSVAMSPEAKPSDDAPKKADAQSAAPGAAPIVGGGGDGSASGRSTTSPVSDPGHSANGPSAGPSTGPRLEDVKTEKTTATGGTYQVRVLSANSLVADEVGKSVNAAASKTDACYSQALKKKVSAGSLSYELSVNAQGSAGTVKLTGDTVKDAPLSKCLESALKAISWPRPTDKAGGKTTIEFTIAK